MINATAKLEHGGFLAALKELDEGIVKFGARFAILTKDFEGFRMISEEVEKVFDRFKETLESGRALTALSNETGQSISDLMQLKQAFDDADVGAEAVGPTMQKFQEKLGAIGPDAQKLDFTLHRLGLSLAELKGKTFLEQLEDISHGLQGVTDQAQKVNIIRELFGREGGKMLSLVGNPEAMETAQQQLGSLPALMQTLAPVFDKLSVAISGLQVKFEQLWTGALSVVAPHFLSLADSFNRLDLTPLGVQIGHLADAFLEIWETLQPLLPSLMTIVGAVQLVAQVVQFAVPIVISLGIGWLAAMVSTQIASMGIVASVRAVTAAVVTGAETMWAALGPLGLSIAALTMAWMVWHRQAAQAAPALESPTASAGTSSTMQILQAHVGHLQSVGGGGGFAVRANAQSPSSTIPAKMDTTNRLLADIHQEVKAFKSKSVASNQPTHRAPV